MSRELTPEEANKLDRQVSEVLIAVGTMTSVFLGALAVRLGLEGEVGSTLVYGSLSGAAAFRTVQERRRLASNHSEFTEPDSECKS